MAVFIVAPLETVRPPLQVVAWVTDTLPETVRFPVSLSLPVVMLVQVIAAAFNGPLSVAAPVVRDELVTLAARMSGASVRLKGYPVYTHRP